MAVESAVSAVRISMIAGRYLVFDPEDVAVLRRQFNTNGVLVGTLPQQPTQNIFLGVPAEIRPEEAQALVAKGCARVVDNVAAHRAVLNSGDRTAYIESLRRKKVTAEKLIAERKAEKIAAAVDKYGQAPGSGKKAKRREANRDDTKQNDDDLFTGDAPQGQNNNSSSSSNSNINTDLQLSVTPSTSKELIPEDVEKEFEARDPPEAPLARFLQDGGYYMTPGLRFGARYSVYPGDPLRYHAHFMANQYGWDEPIPILDLVEGGRLATAVKKAFLIGSQDPSTKEVRAFSVEWASM